MKTFNIFTTGAVAAMLLLSSCVKDVNNPHDGGDGGVEEGIPTYATVSLSQRSGVGTYAADDYYDQGSSGATAEEKKITSAVVLVFNSNDILENYVKFDATDLATDPVAKTFATTTGKKRLYALVNVTDIIEKGAGAEGADVNNKNLSAIEDIFNGAEGTTAADKKLSNISALVQKITGIADATKDDNFWMSNVYKAGATIEEQVEVLNVDKTTVEGGPEDGADGATVNNFTIYVGRMVSKVTPSFAADLKVNSGDGELVVAGATYRVRNNPKRFYTFPVYNDAQLLAPYYSVDYNLAGEDKTWPDVLNAADFFDNTDFVAMGANSYLTENSPQVAERHKVTFLSIKGQWKPNDQAIILQGTGAAAADQAAALNTIATTNTGTFYRVQKWVDGKIVGYCPGIYVETPTAWHEVGTAITTETGAGGLNVKADDRAAAKAAGTHYLPVEYTNGTAYWAYWMRSRTDGTIAEKYALKRNNHFKVNIVSVDGVGDPVEDDNLDKDENIEADTYMKATITVLDWNEVAIEGGI